MPQTSTPRTWRGGGSGGGRRGLGKGAASHGDEHHGDVKHSAHTDLLEELILAHCPKGAQPASIRIAVWMQGLSALEPLFPRSIADLQQLNFEDECRAARDSWPSTFAVR